MRYFLFALLLGALLFTGEWVYRSFLRPVDQPTPEMLALGEHLKSAGLLARFYPVRHGFRHSQVLAHGAYELVNFPLPVSVTACPTEAAAEAYRGRVERSPNLLNPTRIGRLVIDLPMWGEGTEEMMGKVNAAVSSFTPR
jgi:hypothetical protein